MTSLSDLDNGLQRVVSKTLSCKNQPAELNPSAMTQQLEEAKVGRTRFLRLLHYTSQSVSCHHVMTADGPRVSFGLSHAGV